MVLATPAATLAAILDELFNLIESFTPQYKATMGAIDQDWLSSVGYDPILFADDPVKLEKERREEFRRNSPKIDLF